MRKLLFPALVVLAACDATADPQAASPMDRTGTPVEEPADPARARDVVHELHRSLAAGDSARVLELLDPSALIFEAGHQETVDEYRRGHLPADIEFATNVERNVESERVVRLGEAVMYLAETRARGSFRGRDLDVRGVETVILEPRGGAWRIVHVHWSNR